MERQPEQPAKSPSTLSAPSNTNIFQLYAAAASQAAAMNYPWFMPHAHPSFMANFNASFHSPRPFLPTSAPLQSTSDFWHDLYSSQFLPQAYQIPSSTSNASPASIASLITPSNNSTTPSPSANFSNVLKKVQPKASPSNKQLIDDETFHVKKRKTDNSLAYSTLSEQTEPLALTTHRNSSTINRQQYVTPISGNCNGNIDNKQHSEITSANCKSSATSSNSSDSDSSDSVSSDSEQSVSSTNSSASSSSNNNNCNIKEKIISNNDLLTCNKRKKMCNSKSIGQSQFDRPLKSGWKRHTMIKAINSRGIVGDVVYKAPCGKTLQTLPDVARYLQKKNGCIAGNLSKNNFTFSCRAKIGEFFDCRQSKNLSEDEQDNNVNVRRLTAEEFRLLTNRKIASRQRKIEQERRLEEKRLEKLRRIELQKEQKELKARQLLQEKARKKEQLHAEAMRKAQEREQKRQKALIMKEKERDRKRHYALYCRALEARKKLEEKERIKIERLEEQNKEPQLLVDDLTLSDSLDLPDLKRMDDNDFSAKSFSFLLQVYEFLHTFSETLGLDNLPTLLDLKRLVKNDITCHPCLIHLVSFVKVDPGVGDAMTFDGKQKIINVIVNNENVFMVLRSIMDWRLLGLSPFNGNNWEELNVEEKSKTLACLVDELIVSRVLMAEIDRSVEDISVARQNFYGCGGRLKKNNASVSQNVVVNNNSKRLKTQTVESGSESGGASSGGEDEDEPETQIATVMEDDRNNLQAKFTKACRRVRGLELGQDRFWRRYWILSESGGVFIEGVETSEPDICPILKIEHEMDHDNRNEKNLGGNNFKRSILDDRLLTCRFFTNLQQLFPDLINNDLLPTVEDKNWFSLLPRKTCQLSELLLDKNNETNNMEDERAIKMSGDVKNGFWYINDSETFSELISKLNNRGIREHGLLNNLKQYTTEALSSILRFSDVLDGKCLMALKDDTSLDREISVLEMVEALEERICSSSLQVKGWQWPAKLSSSNFLVGLGQPLTPQKRYALDVARERLLLLEANIEKRYLVPPLGTVAQDGEIPEGDSVALKSWRSCVSCARSVAALSTCVNELSVCVAWHKSIMKVSCQLCMKDEDEANLLLCDCCDKGFHTYCFIPPMKSIPENDWFCHHCKAASEHLPKVCVVCGKNDTTKLITCHICCRARHVACMKSVNGRLPKNWCCLPCSMLKQVNSIGKQSKKKNSNTKSTKKNTSAFNFSATTLTSTNTTTSTTTTTTTTATNNYITSNGSDLLDSIKLSDDLDICRIVLQELENHTDSWPFMQPVNTQQFPQYKQVIKKPMDLSTIRNKLCQAGYAHRSNFVADIRLIFNNCKKFNEDESEVGQCGINLSQFFKRTWKQLTNSGGGAVT